MSNDPNHYRYYVIAVIGIVAFMQGVFTTGDKASFPDESLADHPLLIWPGWSRRMFYISVGIGIFVFALWKLRHTR